MMRFRQATMLAALALGTVGLAVSTHSDAQAMSAYKWKNRPLLVFAPAAGGASMQRQLSIVRANFGGFRRRDMVVVVVRGNRVSMALGRGQRLNAKALRQRYGVSASAFRAILVGKDGGAKISSGTPLNAGRLFQTIDAMPMRRDEMRRRGR